MSVARFSCPQVPDAPLRTTEQPVDVAAVGISCYLRRDPNGQTRERLCKRPVHTEDTLEGRETHLHLLTDRWTPIRLFRREHDGALGQLRSEPTAAVGQIPQQPSGEVALAEAGRGHEFAHEERVSDV